MIKIKKNFSLKKYNTFQVNAYAKFFVEVFSSQDILDLIKKPEFQKNKFFILWWWANVLFTKNFNWLIIKVSISWKKIIESKWNDILVQSWAWEDWHDFIMRCIDRNLAWLENLVLIPWQVWSSAVGNIGAYGSEVKDHIYEIYWINLKTKKFQKIKKSECKFGYRDSIFKNKLKNNFIITDVIFKLWKADKNYKPNYNYHDIKKKILEWKINARRITIRQLADIIIQTRRIKLPDPKKIGTAWSFFKNPIISKTKFKILQKKYPELIWFPSEKNLPNISISNSESLISNAIKLSAGQLIDLAGFKWFRKWNVWTYQNHALVLVNHGKATGQEIAKFANQIQKKVLAKFGVKLEPEVIFI